MGNYTIYTCTNKPYFLISNPRNTNIVLECGNIVLGGKGGLYGHAAKDETEVVDLGPCAHSGLYRSGGGCLCGVRWLLDGEMGWRLLPLLAQTSSQAGRSAWLLVLALILVGRLQAGQLTTTHAALHHCRANGNGRCLAPAVEVTVLLPHRGPTHSYADPFNPPR